ncbi:Fic family protein [Patescibacteria group bacterium]|nr:Fic family protein [Patescibacteria group bacterium]MBU1885009.1 Fic family protein [Patescibacteria group bacterium]
MFVPKYTITNKLLAQIKQINSLINQLNQQHFPQVILAEFEKTARSISTFASTSIEGNPLPLTEVKKILKNQPQPQLQPQHLRDSEKEVLNYNQALQDLDQQLFKGQIKFDLKLILKIQGQVIKDLLPPHQINTLRQEPVVIRNAQTRQIIFMPPDVKDVKTLMKELINFVNKNQGKIDTLILAGIFHKQFVIIHPFMDGNGRTTRLATKFLLAQLGLNTFNLFSFENYYNQNVTRYFQQVGELGDYYDLNKLDFTTWLEYFAEGIIDELMRVQKVFPQSNQGPSSQLKDYHKKILKFIQRQGFITDHDYAQLVERAKSTRAKDFSKLIELGLIERKGQGRATYYVNVALAEK